jgi:preprotein translocase subunit SecA
MIVAQAGRLGSVTVATNMAGRGVDILLGGNAEYLARQEMAAREFDNDAYLMFELDEQQRSEYEIEYEPIYEKFKAQTDAEHDEVVEAGGLFVLGTERHESRRIDNQLRGRSGRQGDPGESRFYLSFEDDLMRLFASDRVSSLMERLKWPEGEPIESRMVTKTIESAQRQVEEQNFEIRKNVLKYDEVQNTQRQVIYEERRKILEGHDLKDEALDMTAEVVEGLVTQYVSRDIFPEEWDIEQMLVQLDSVFPTTLTTASFEGIDDPTEVLEMVLTAAADGYREKEEVIGSSRMRDLERVVLMNVTDTAWREHLYEMDYLQEGIGLRAYGQRDPLVEYQRDAYQMFAELKETIRDQFVRYVYRTEFVKEDGTPQQRAAKVQTNQAEVEGVATGGGETGATEQAVSDKVGRNAPCPCGSGRKYKKCHGATV